ncbi:MAG: hypothetical protein MZU97_15535 [Bacillus subtilis]|nr:hypothetical protein [Bacillus subtilis]
MIQAQSRSRDSQGLVQYARRRRTARRISKRRPTTKKPTSSTRRSNKLHKEGVPYREMAVLYRNNAMSRKFEDVMLKYNIPYKVIGNLSFYKRKEIKDVIAYLRLIVNRRRRLRVFTRLQRAQAGDRRDHFRENERTRRKAKRQIDGSRHRRASTFFRRLPLHELTQFANHDLEIQGQLRKSKL